MAPYRPDNCRADIPAQEAYWKNHLCGDLPLLGLPLDYPRPPVKSFVVCDEAIELDEKLSSKLHEFCSTEDTTLFVVLLSALKAVLLRITGQEDIIVGTLSSDSATAKDSLRFFRNPIVLRTVLDGNPTALELLERVERTVVNASKNRDYSFDSLVEHLEADRDTERGPVFQAMFILCDEASTVSDLPISETDISDVAETAARCDVVLKAHSGEDRLRLRCEYDAELFESTSIKRMLECLRTLLDDMVANAGKRVGELALLTKKQRRQALVAWNDTRRDYPGHSSVSRLFEAQVKRMPDTVAVVSQGMELTYGELNGRANQLARHLRALGVGPGVRVGVCMGRSPEMVIGLIGILKASGAYVPLDPSHPRQRSDFALKDVRASVLLTQGELAFETSANARHVIRLDEDWDRISVGVEREAGSNCVCLSSADDPAYVMYTSGSTGEPKGVEVTNRGILRLLFGVEYVDLGADRSILQMAPVSFDASTFEIWGPLLHGGRCVLYPDAVPTVGKLGEVIESQDITTLWLTGSLFNTVIDEAPEILRDIEQLLIGGEALSVEHVRRAYEALPLTRIVNGYGPTEGTTFTCCHKIPRVLSGSARSIPIGRPISNTAVYILDRYMEPVPVGVSGELYIGGAGLSSGYVGDAGLTVEKYVPNPFSGIEGDRMYRTGDLCRYLSDGSIEFIGRVDHQVKLRGFRIELGEIESVLVGHELVRESVALYREDEPGEKRLVAYVVLERGSELGVTELRGYLREKLPEYMIPSRYVMLESLPLTSSGKVDRLSLPAPEGLGRELESSYVAPRTEVEEKLAGIWSQVLGVERVGIHDNFFELGGHSLKATQVVSRVQADFQVALPVRSLFDAATVAGFSEVIERARKSGEEDKGAEIVPISREKPRKDPPPHESESTSERE